MHLKISEILKMTDGRLISGNPEICVESFSTDTRHIKPGDFFIGLKGENFDGSLFAPEAFKMGAIGVMVNKVPEGIDLSPDKNCVVVEDPLRALGDLAALWRQKKNPGVVAVMGSSGKTTTREMIVHLASSRFALTATKGNNNNAIGLPLTLFDMDDNTDVAVVELGMNAVGEMRRLGEISDPDFLVVTNIGRAHIGMFGSREGLIRAKAEIFDSLRPECLLITNVDCPYTSAFLKHARHKHPRFTYGAQRDAHIRATDIQSLSLETYQFSLFIDDQEWGVMRIPLFGRFNVYNALAAISALYAMGMDMDAIGEDIQRFIPARMRSETHHINGVRIISDCYNANPDSVTQALYSLREGITPGKTTVVLGDMLELGADEEKYHKEVGALFADLDVDLLITYGKLSSLASEEAASWGQTVYHAQTHEEIASFLLDRISPGDAVLIKGSRRMQLENVVRMVKDFLGSHDLVAQEKET
ncbi:UDP-N-acetylmuramoyl-tripeptide--D-alanyl-D-alanine ligase [Candidatus Sumerlaeota bacterium]|nr:UDP-N-acetylmuramoyl-tripeptide--D-alanyl-D-alanine ligase [Candidatus Sumerlaeota bacterium]